MIQILPCPKCSKHLALPIGVSQEALIRCPQCRYEIVLAESIASHFGAWEVVKDPADEQAGDDSSAVTLSNSEEATLDSAGQVAGLPEFATAAANSIEGPPATEMQMNLGPLAAESETPKDRPSWSEFKSSRKDKYERRKRRSASPFWSVLQVALGGLAAIPIALLLLWWVVGKDIGGAGPLVAEYLPWIVPEEFRPLDRAADRTAASRDRRRSVAGRSSGLPDVPSESVRPSADADDGARGGNTSAASSEVSGNRPLGDALSDSSTDADAVKTENRPPAATVASTGDISTIGSSPAEMQVDVAESQRTLVLRLDECQQSLERWQTAVRSGAGDLRPIAKSIYGSLIDAATLINEFSPEDSAAGSLRSALQPISRSIEHNQDLQSVITQGAIFWSGQNTDADEFSLAIIVRASGVTEDLKCWNVKGNSSVALPESIRTIQIPRHLAPAGVPGQKLLLLGKVSNLTDADVEQAPNARRFVASYLYAL